ncbi:hypothetical protein GF351_02955 [Candidatus Woesearchaeota archaeon]|nr:hypothetical protein [Candidatus Woesearchaeota archaeon]
MNINETIELICRETTKKDRVGMIENQELLREYRTIIERIEGVYQIGLAQGIEKGRHQKEIEMRIERRKQSLTEIYKERIKTRYRELRGEIVQ